MDMQHLIGLAINASMFLIVFGIGLHASVQDATYLFRHPGLLLRSLVAMNLVMLVAALLIVVLFNMAPEIEIALVALALSPVPPILPGKQLKAGGTSQYTVGLLAAASVAAIVVVPLGILLIDVLFGRSLHISPGDVAGIVVVSVLVPLFAGILIRTFAPAFAERIARPVSLIGTIVLGLAFIPVLIVSWGPMLAFIGDGLLFGLVAFTLIGLAAGHLLGGPDPDNRTVLALASSARHPGVAIAIASLNFPDAKGALLVVLYHLIIGAIAAIPYVKWRTREHAAAHRGAT
jgi:BASS family bile acid:Na+ symporter